MMHTREQRPITQFDGSQYRRHSSMQKEWGSRLIADLELRGNERILDVGCGDGMLSAQLADRVPDGHVVGLDVSSSMLDVARQNQRPNLSFQHSDVLSLKDEDRYDLVFSNATLHWVTNHQRLMTVLYKALRKGGTLRANFGGHGNCETTLRILRSLTEFKFRRDFSDFAWPYYMPAAGEYEDLLRGTQFEQVRIWLENADHYFPNATEFEGWLAQTAILPFKQHLKGRAAERFHQEAASRLIGETLQHDGRCFERFRRINVLAKK